MSSDYSIDSPDVYHYECIVFRRNNQLIYYNNYANVLFISITEDGIITYIYSNDPQCDTLGSFPEIQHDVYINRRVASQLPNKNRIYNITMIIIMFTIFRVWRDMIPFTLDEQVYPS